MNPTSMRVAITGLLALAGTVLAQTNQVTELPELNIASGLEASRLPEFSTSTTVLDAKTFTDRNDAHLQDALGLVPNLNFAGAVSRPRYFQLRGIGERSQFAGEGPPNFSVGFIVDDIDLSGVGMAGALFDVAQVEVLRGPQATVYGSKALAGLINITSNEAIPLRDHSVQIAYGTDDYYELGYATGGSMSDEDIWSYRFSIFLTGSNGYRDNTFLDREDTNERQELTSRLKFRYQPTDETTVDITLFGAILDNGYDQFSVTGDGFTMISDEPGEDSQEVIGASVRATLQSADAFDFISITSGSYVDSTYSYDADWANDAFWAAPPYNFDPAVEGFRYSFFEILERERTQVSQDFRWLGKNRLWNMSDWSVGVYGSYIDETDDYVGFSELQSEYDASTLAVYGQLTTWLSQELALITSLRVEERWTNYTDQNNPDYDTSDTMPGGRVALEYALNPTANLFASVSRGFKGSGVNQNPNTPEENRFYDPEYVWNYEVGARTQWAEGRGFANLTLFYMDRTDLQIGTSLQTDPGDPTSFTFFTDNAAEGYNAGLELEFRQPLGNRVNLFGALGLLETEYENFEDAGGANNIDGREQPHAPSYNFSVGLDVNLSCGWFARVDVEGKDSYYFSDSHDQQSDSYALLNLSLRYQAQNWSISFWGRNVTDESYDTRGYFFGQEPPDYPSKLWTSKGDPAQFGVTVRMNF